MILENRIVAFRKLANILIKSRADNLFHHIIKSVQTNNPWFTEKNVYDAAVNIGKMLINNDLLLWLNNYNIQMKHKRVGVIVPSNIPFVGFYDFMCVLLSGNIFIGKLSRSNKVILPFIAGLLIEIDKKFSNFIFFEDEILDCDLLIATGNDDTARYFNSLYSGLPSLIRKNRNSIAVLNGSESYEDYIKIAYDVYTYFGLGCRSVTKLYLPIGFDLELLRGGFYEMRHLVFSHDYYMDNYRYQKVFCRMNNIDFNDFDYLLFVESNAIASPISVVYFDYYDNINTVVKSLLFDSDKIQCVTSLDDDVIDKIPFGNTQSPSLYDFPDGIDVVKFLTSH